MPLVGDQIIDVSRRHPIYTKMLSYWDFYRDSYKGGYDYVKPDPSQGYLYPHSHESLIPLKYTERHNRSIYLNYCRLPINTYTKYIFSAKEQITREHSDVYNPYIDDFDLNGNSVNIVMKRLTTNMLIYGLCYAVVDKLPITPEYRSLGQQQELGLRAYVNCIPPELVLDWSIDSKTKEYNWVLIKSIACQDVDYKKKRSDESLYYLWTKDNFYELDSKGCPLGPDSVIPNALGYIPIVRIEHTDLEMDGIPESMLADIALINREIYNVTSLYQEELYKIAFAMIMKAKSKDSFDLQMTLDEQIQYISSSIVMEYPEGTTPPQYLTPPVQALVEKRAYIDSLIMKILQMANLGNEGGVQSTAYQSGIAMSFAYNDTHFSVAMIAKKMEFYERQLWNIIQDYDELEDDIEIRYPENYDVRTDIERREGFKVINESLTGSPTLLTENATQYYTQVIAVAKDVQSVIDKELEEHYNQVSQGTLEEEVSGIGAENIRPFIPEQGEVDETIEEETL